MTWPRGKKADDVRLVFISGPLQEIIFMKEWVFICLEGCPNTDDFLTKSAKLGCIIRSTCPNDPSPMRMRMVSVGVLKAKNWGFAIEVVEDDSI